LFPVEVGHGFETAELGTFDPPLEAAAVALGQRKKLQELMEESKEDAEEKTPEWAD